MSCRIPWVIIALLFAPVIAMGQSTAKVSELRAAIKAMEEQLQQLEKVAESPNQRITRIGESSERGREVLEQRQVVQLYDLSDLFVVAPTYAAQIDGDLVANPRLVFPASETKAPASGGFGGGFGGGGLGGGGMGGGGGGFFDVPSRATSTDVRVGTLRQFGGGAEATAVNNLAASRTSLDDLISAIEMTIDPDEWNSAGGSSAIEQLGNSLLISAKPATHRQISDLLALFRKRWGTLRTVSTRAYWLWLNHGQLEALLLPPAARDTARPAIASEAFGLVDDAAWQSALRKQPPFDDRTAGYFAAITGYHGQTVSTLAGRQQLIVANLTSVVGGAKTEQGVGYNPTVSTVQEGAALQVTPLTTANAKYVVLDVHSRVQWLSGNAAEPAGVREASHSAAENVVSALDRPSLMVHRLSTTARLPVDRVVLVGGMTTSSPDDRQLYLFVQLSVQELRDDPLDADAAATSTPSVTSPN